MNHICGVNRVNSESMSDNRGGISCRVVVKYTEMFRYSGRMGE